MAKKEKVSGDVEKDLGVKSQYTSEEIERRYSHQLLRPDKTDRYYHVTCRHGFPQRGLRCPKCRTITSVAECSKCKRLTKWVGNTCLSCEEKKKNKEKNEKQNSNNS